MNNIVCKIDLFSTQQQIYLLHETGGIENTINCPLTTLGETLAQLALNKNSQTVNIMGNEEYSKKVKEILLSSFCFTFLSFILFGITTNEVSVLFFFIWILFHNDFG